MPGVSAKRPSPSSCSVLIANHPDMHEMMRNNPELAQKMWMESTASTLSKFNSAQQDLVACLHLQDLAEVKHKM